MAAPAARAVTARRWPRPLRAGDRVAVVAPSGPVDAGRLARGIAMLASWGLDVTLGAHVHDADHYLAGADRDRAGDLISAWTDPEVAAVICARGGYGATRLLPLLGRDLPAGDSGKAFVGASDITALHTLLGNSCDLVTFFGPMPAAVLGSDEPDPRSTESLRAVLFGEPLAPLSGASARAGSAKGRLVGGTLTLLAAMTGTPYASTARDCIAFLEDVDEEAYQLDRMLTQLLQAGWFDGVRGIALGSWQHCGDSALDTVLERLAPLGVPVVTGLQVGHGPVQLTLPLGADATLDATTDAARLVVQSP